MVQKYVRRSEQEWMDLIQECRTSGFSDKDWCEQQGIPVSSFYNKISKLRKKACDLPHVQTHIIQKPQQVVPISITEEEPLLYHGNTSHQASDPVMVLDMNGCRIEVMNHAAKDTIFDVLTALQQLC